MELSGAQLADTLGVSRAAITQARNRGDLRRGPGGGYDPRDPLTVAYAGAQALRRGEDPRALLDLLTALAPPPADPAPWTRDRVDPAAPFSTLEVRADFGHGPVLVVRHSFDRRDKELDLVVGAVPRAVKLDYSEDDPIVRDAETGETIPSVCTVRARGRELVQEVHA